MATYASSMGLIPEETKVKVEEKKVEPQPETGLSYKKSELVTLPPIEQAKNEKVIISDRSIKTLADTLAFHYQIYKKNPQGLADWQIQLVASYDAQFSGANAGDPNANFRKYLEDPSKMVFALKVAEWEMATLQMSTGLMAKEIRRFEPQKPLVQKKERYTFNEKGDFIVTLDESTSIENTSFFAKAANWFKAKEQPQTEQQLSYDLYFQDRNSAQESFVNQPEYISNDSISDDSQKAFITGFFGSEKGQISPEYLESLKNKFNQLMAARLEIYGKTGADRANVQLNFIESANNIAGFGYVNFASKQSRLNIDVNTSEQNYRLRTEEQLNKTTKDFAAKLKAKAEELSKQTKEQSISSVVDSHISRLGQKVVSESDEEEIKSHDANIASLTEQLAKAEQATKIKKEITNLQKQIGSPGNGLQEDIEKAVNYELSIQNGGFDKIFGIGNDSIAGLTTTINKAEADIKRIEAQKESLKTNRDKKETALSQYLSSQSVLTANGQGINLPNLEVLIKRTSEIIDDLENKIKEKENDIEIKEKEIISAKDQKTRLEVLKTKPGIAESVRQYGQLSQMLQSKQDEYNLLRAGVEIGYHKGSEITDESITEIKSALKTAESQKTALEKDEFQQWRKASYETYREYIMKNTEQIMNRAYAAEQAQFVPADIWSRYIQANYPDWYLLTLQIIAGPEITSPKPDQIELFNKLSKLVTAAYIEQIFHENKFYGLITCEKISPNIISKLLGKLRTEAYDGDLDMIQNQNKILSWTNVLPESVSAPNYAIFNRYSNEYGIYGYRSLNELCARMSLFPLFQGTVLSQRQIKYCAEQFDLEYRKIFAQ